MVDVEGELDLGDLWEIHGLDGYQSLHEEPWTPVNAGPFSTPRGQARPVRRDAPRRPAGPPPLRLLLGQRGAAGGAGRARQGRAGDQDDRVPHLRRLGPGAAADRGRRAGQAGGVPGGAQGPLRRAAQHRLGALAGGGGRPRGARAARAQDPREGAADRAPRGPRRAPLRAHRDRQLPRQDGPAVRGLRPVHHRPWRSPPTWPTCSTR